MFNMGNMMKQAQMMQERLQKAQEEIANLEVVGESGAGMVKVTMTGSHEVRRVEIDDSKQAQRRLNELKQKIRSLGNVNVSAIEEYKEVSERYEFMSAQVNDVEKSKKEIEKLITDLTKQMKVHLQAYRL